MKTNSENPGPLYLQHVLDPHFFLSHAYITLTFFNQYWVGEELPERLMLKNVQQQDEKENSFLFLCLWSVVIRLTKSFSFGSSDLLACLTRMLLFADNAVIIIIALILAISEITLKTEDVKKITAHYQEFIPLVCIYTWCICRSFWEKLRVLLWFKTYLPKRGVLIKRIFSFSTV